MKVDDAILKAQDLAYDGYTIEEIKLELVHVLKEEDKKLFHLQVIDFLAHYQLAVQAKENALVKMIRGLFILGLAILVTILSIWKGHRIFIIAIGAMIYGVYKSIKEFKIWNRPTRAFIPKSNLNFKKKGYDRYTN